MFTNCKTDINTYCKDARTQFRGNATVLKCLTDNFSNLADQCQVRRRPCLPRALPALCTGQGREVWSRQPAACLPCGKPSCTGLLACCPQGVKLVPNFTCLGVAHAD